MEVKQKSNEWWEELSFLWFCLFLQVSLWKLFYSLWWNGMTSKVECVFNFLHLFTLRFMEIFVASTGTVWLLAKKKRRYMEKNWKKFRKVIM